jgi:hypothetical protein
MTFRSRIAAFTAAGALLAALAGCSSGGALSCGDYRSKNTHDRLVAVSQMLKDRSQPNGMLSVYGVELSVDAYCFSHPSSATIDGIYKS